MIKRRSVALLRHQIEPVSQPALAVFLPRWHRIVGPERASLRGPEGLLEAVRSIAGVPVPVSTLETSILPQRILDYAPAMLDELTSAGEVMWTGSAALPGGDGWIALVPSDVSFLLPRASAPIESALASAILEVLNQGGGWFLADIVGRMAHMDADPGQVAAGVRDLLWAGLISNDTIEPVRATRDRALARNPRVTPRSMTRSGRVPRGRYADLWRATTGRAIRADGAPPSATVGASSSSRAAAAGSALDLPGRWFALPDVSPPPEVRALASAEAHLERSGLVTRGSVLAAGEPGGFAAVYRTLAAMEERGRVQRVYAVDGLGASQFALPGVVDQLRAIERETSDHPGDEVVVLAVSDPANAYGAALDWPPTDWTGPGAAPHRPSRSAGSHVVLRSGRPVLYVERGGRSLLTFPDESTDREGESEDRLRAAANCLRTAVSAGQVPALLITRINGMPALEAREDAAAIGQALVDAGFSLTPRGYRARQ
jgi:ATP-dependent Lhr-like helicase